MLKAVFNSGQISTSNQRTVIGKEVSDGRGVDGSDQGKGKGGSGGGSGTGCRDAVALAMMLEVAWGLSNGDCCGVYAGAVSGNCGVGCCCGGKYARATGEGGGMTDARGNGRQLDRGGVDGGAFGGCVGDRGACGGGGGGGASAGDVGVRLCCEGEGEWEAVGVCVYGL